MRYLLCLLIVAGCAAEGEVVREFVPARRKEPARLEPLTLEEFQVQMVEVDRLGAEGKPLESYEVLRDAVRRRPPIQNDGAALLLAMCLKMLGQLTSIIDNPMQYESDAHELFHAGMTLTNNALVQITLYQNIAVFYSRTMRNGKAAEYASKAVELAMETEGVGRLEVAALMDLVSVAYSDMGQTDLALFYGAFAEEHIRAHFGEEEVAPAEWPTFVLLAQNRLNVLAISDRRAAFDDFWTFVESRLQTMPRPRMALYPIAAANLASFGDLDEAERLLARGRTEMDQDLAALPEASDAVRKYFEHDLRITEAMLRTMQGRHAEALQLATAAMEGVDVNHPGTFRVRARASEGVGDLDEALRWYDRAISVLERGRDSFSIVDRVAYFSGNKHVRSAYWGRTRTLMRKAIQSGSEPDFFAALNASEYMRGRQLGELIGQKAHVYGRKGIPDPASARSVLAPGEVMLSYMLTEDEILCLALSRTGRRVEIIPYEKKAFDSLVRTAAEMLSNPDSDAAALREKLAAISAALFEPVRNMALGAESLLILSDGPLSAIPFEALTLQRDSWEPIVRTTPVRMSPSLGLLTIERRKRRIGGILALGDPKYAHDPTVGGTAVSQLRAVAKNADVEAYFGPLPETRSEVEAIGNLVGGATYLLEAEATETNIKRQPLGRYRYLHFATHGILGNEVPGLMEPALVLAEETVDESERAGNGFLTASEVEKFRLGAELTVLSACKTGSGEYFSGEGVMGMSRAFLVAGSTSVLVSLWSVDSRATEALMVSFYRHLEETKGITKAEALRLAKVEILNEWRPSADAERRGIDVVGTGAAPQAEGPLHPFYWSAFVLVGN